MAHPLIQAGAALSRLTATLSTVAIMLALTGCPDTVRNQDPIRAALISSDNDDKIAQKQRELAAVQKRIDQAEADKWVGGGDALLGAVDDADASRSGDMMKGLRSKGHIVSGGAQAAMSEAELKSLNQQKKHLEKEIKKLQKENRKMVPSDHASDNARDAIKDANRGAARPHVDISKPEVDRPDGGGHEGGGRDAGRPDVHRPEPEHHCH